MQRVSRLLALLLVVVSGWANAGEDQLMAMTITSPAFDEGGDIPQQYTCDGEDLTPALRWQGVPDGTRSLVLIVDDPDAPDPAAPQTIWVHWVLYNLPPSVESLPEGVVAASLPAGAREGLNDWKREGWNGPCPPVGQHRYFFKLYALDTALPDLGLATKNKVLQAMIGHVLDEAQLMATYQH